MTDRRQFVLASAAMFAGMGHAQSPRKGTGTFGIVIHSYPTRSREKGFSDPLKFLEFCRERGADGVQSPLGQLTGDQAKELRAAADKYGLYVEGSIRAPKDKADVERFESEIKTSRECGATVVRTVMLSGRRYETFRTEAEFAEFVQRAYASLTLAAPVMAKQNVVLAVENHKDFRTDELIAFMKTFASEHVGVCVDTGNNLALLEPASQTVEALAPWAVACHLKDMGVEESADGFLLSEVPLGDGFLELKQIIETLRKARPTIRFSLEMITRDPLRIPCLTDEYWATMDKTPARDLARMLALVKKHAKKEPLPRIAKLNKDDQLAVEDRNVRRSIDYGRAKLGL
jgi:sugar phosphate isomerase/epimerase